MTRPRDIGTRAETAVVRALRRHGFPHAERRALRGSTDAGDITGTPGICWEVKGGQAARTASDGQILAWLVELEAERLNAHADIGVLVVQRAGIGAPNAHRWWAILFLRDVARLTGATLPDRLELYPVRMLLADAAELLCNAGYGSAPTTAA